MLPVGSELLDIGQISVEILFVVLAVAVCGLGM